MWCRWKPINKNYIARCNRTFCLSIDAQYLSDRFSHFPLFPSAILFVLFWHSNFNSNNIGKMRHLQRTHTRDQLKCDRRHKSHWMNLFFSCLLLRCGDAVSALLNWIFIRPQRKNWAIEQHKKITTNWQHNWISVHFNINWSRCLDRWLFLVKVFLYLFRFDFIQNELDKCVNVIFVQSFINFAKRDAISHCFLCEDQYPRWIAHSA